MAFLAALDAEMAELENSLNADPRVTKWRELYRVRALYGANDPPPRFAPPNPFRSSFLSGPTNGTGATPKPEAPPPSNRQTGTSGRKPSPERLQALLATREFLTGKTAPTRTAEILAHLVGRGIMLKGNDPQSNLSAMLYHSPDFQSHQRAGWTLKNGSAT